MNVNRGIFLSMFQCNNVIITMKCNNNDNLPCSAPQPETEQGPIEVGEEGRQMGRTWDEKGMPPGPTPTLTTAMSLLWGPAEK